MNIVYKFTSKVTGKYYIGSKCECTVVDGQIIDRNGKAYFTSSFSEDLLDEFANGTMELEVLERDVLRDNLLTVEASYQREVSAVEDINSYNKIYADLKNLDGSGFNYHKTFDRANHNGYGNIYKETIKEITWRNRSVARRDTKAQELGFLNYGEMHEWALRTKEDASISFKELDRRVGAVGFFKRSIAGLHYVDFLREDVDLILVKDLLIKGKTLIKICEDLGYPESVVRYRLGHKNIKHVFEFEDRIAVQAGFLNRLELEKYIMREYLKEVPLTKIAETLDNVSHSTCRRVVDRIVRERLKINDFE